MVINHILHVGSDNGNGMKVFWEKSWCGYDMWEVLGEMAIGEEGSVPTHCHHQHKGGGGDCLQEGQWVTNWEEVFFRNVLEIFPGYLNLSVI